MSRQGTFAGIVAGLTGVLEDIRDADGGLIQIVGWRPQQAHTPPSAWIEFGGSSATHERGGKVDDRMSFDLWLTRSPDLSENDDLAALAALADVAVPIVDAACADARDRFGVNFVQRTAFRFAVAEQSGNEPALHITITARWSGTYC